MSRTPRVSVVIPGKDVAGTVTDTLTSLTRQFDDPGDLEVVVVDDGSTDTTSDVVESFSPRFPDLSLVVNPAPVGLASARNQGLAAARGRYVAYLDADDWLAPGHLPHLADAMDTLRVDFVRTDHTTVEGRRRSLVRAPQSIRGVPLLPRSSVLPATERTQVDYPYAWAGLFDRALAEDGLLTFPDGLFTAEDRPWIWRLYLHARSYATVDSPGILYRRGLPGSLTQTYDARQLDVVPALHQAFDVVEADEEAEVLLTKLARTTIALTAHHLRRSLRMAPASRRRLRHGARSLLARIPADVLAFETARIHPGRAWALHGLLPHPDPRARYRPPPSVLAAARVPTRPTSAPIRSEVAS
ncbi:glycosyltransferase family 2 protein [Isoptericola haloaureus]|uniref:Glycosyltransferase n=1 Tax=Isoptericola haloaureus TaxID=1542902 RepID=A0ABU7Z503_9MICO